MTSETPLHSPRGVRAALGTLGLFVGVLWLVLCGIEEATGLRGMPRSWYTNRPLWWFFGVAITFAGSRLLAPRVAEEQLHWRPTRSGIRFKQVLLYTRPGCHLCDDARELLSLYHRWLPRVIEVNIDSDPRLVEKYGTCIPVIACDNKVRFRSRVPPELLQRLIEGTPAV